MVAGMSTCQSKEVKSGVTEANVTADSFQWCLMWETTTYSVKQWPSGEVVRVNVMTHLVQMS
jgi:hypothetical protein